VQYMADCMLDMRHLYGKSATQGSAHSRMVA
jgi:hypothetical protein